MARKEHPQDLLKDQLFLVCLLLLASLYIYSANGVPSGPADESEYMILAKAFTLGKLHTIISEPREPFDPVAYPLYPIIISPIFFFFSGEEVYARVASALFCMGSFAVLYLIGRRYLGYKTAIAFAIFVCVSHMVLYYSTQILTETPYLFLSVVTIYFITADVQKSHTRRHIVFCLLCYSFLTRGSGLILCLSLFVWWLYSREFKKSLVPLSVLLIGFIILAARGNIMLLNRGTLVDLSGSKSTDPVGSWNPVNWATMYISGVSDHFRGYILDHYASNVLPIFKYHPKLAGYLLPWILDSRENVLYWVGVIIFIITLLGLVNSKTDFIKFYTIMYTGATVVMLAVSGIGRYLMPVLPFLMLYFLLGVKYLSELPRRWVSPSLIFSSALVLLLIGSIYHAASFSMELHSQKMVKELEELNPILDWLRENTKENDIILASWDRRVYLSTGRKTVSSKNLWEVVRENGSSFDNYLSQLPYRPRWTVFSYDDYGYYYGPTPPEGYFEWIENHSQGLLTLRYTSPNSKFKVFEISA